MRIQFTLFSILVALAIFAAISWNYSPRTIRVVIEKTGRMLDLAFVGAGYFELTHPSDGTIVYCRNGRFEIDNCGLIVHSKSLFVLSPAVTIPPDQPNIEVKPTGQITTTNRDLSEKIAVGQLCISYFPYTQKLLPIENGCYSATVDSGQPISQEPGTNSSGHIAQGWLETETPRWTLQDGLPILMLTICIGTAALQIWLSIIRHRTAKTP